MATRPTFPDPAREFRVMPEEADHYRSELQPGDIVRGEFGNLARLVAWDHTWSHIYAGRIAHLQPLVSYPGTQDPEDALPFSHVTSWEYRLSLAQPGDVGAHADRPGPGWHYISASWTRAAST
jgi:hypothetical protein